MSDGYMEFVQGQRFNPYQRFIGSFIPNGLVRFGGLRPAAMMVWGRLAQYAGQDGQCFPSEGKLAKDLGWSTRTVQRQIRILREYGLIESVRRYGHRNLNQYYFLWDDRLKDSLRGPSGTKIIKVGASNDDSSVVSCGDNSVGCYSDKADNSNTTRLSPEQTIQRTEIQKEKHNCEVWWEDVESTLGKWVVNCSTTFPLSLSQEERRYIILQTGKRMHENRLRNPLAYVRKLGKLALRGDLNMSDFDEIEAWYERYKGRP